MGRHANPEAPPTTHPGSHPGQDGDPLDDSAFVFPPAADAASPSSPRGPGRRTALTLLGGAAAVAATGAAATAVSPGTTRALVGRLTGATTAAGPGAAALAGASTGATSGALSGAASAAADVPLATGSAAEGADATKPVVEYQSSGAGKAPAAVTTAAVTQPPTILTLDQAKHLARRAAWGPTPALVKSIRASGTKAWVAKQLKPATIKDTTVDRLLAKLDTLGRTPAQLRAMNPTREKADYFYAHTQLEQAALIRAAWSNRQLYEVLVDFFHSRLHVPGHFDKSRDTLNHYDVHVIRKHALGRFEAMVWAMLNHPAMILYLDNQQNTKFGGNQNLGRELLELHTLGVDAGYTQADVVAASKLLTGLSVDDKTLKTLYRPEQHFVGKVKVFGHTFANSTAANGRTAMRNLVKFLTHHPKTAEYLALDLARRFVSDAPPKALVKRLAKTYLANDTAIAPMVRQLLNSAEFKASVGQKYRRPLESTVATVRVLGLRPSSDWAATERTLRDLRWNLDQMGQTPLGHSSPDGYADFAQPWLSTVGTLSRWNMQMALAGGWNKGLTKADVSAWLAGATTYGAAVDKLALRLLQQKPKAAQRAALLAFLEKTADAPLSANARANDYNLRVRVPALILGAPQHQLR